MANVRNPFYRCTPPRCNAAAGILLALICLMGCQNKSSIEGIEIRNAARLKVNVFSPQRIENATQTANYFGKLRANRAETLGFPVGGKLSTMPDAQQKYADGEVIATLDAATLLQQVDQLQQQLSATSPTDRSSRRNVDLESQIADLQNQIQQRSISAPFDCIVERAFVSANSLIRPGAAVVSVVETTNPKIEINIPRRIVNRIDTNSDYMFNLDGQEFAATVRERAFSESPPGNVRMIFDIKNQLSEIDFYLDQIVEARFSFPTNQSGYWLPLSCLQQSSDGVWTVLVAKPVEKKHVIQRQAVTIAQLRDDSVLVTDDLEEQLIVRDGVHRVVPGQSVDLNLVTLDVDAAGESPLP